MNAMLGSWLGLERFPVRDTPARAATDRSQGLVALNVFVRVLGVPFDHNGAELEVHPRSADAAAERTIASRGHRRCGRERQFDRAAVAGTLVHGSAPFNAAEAAASCHITANVRRPYAKARTPASVAECTPSLNSERTQNDVRQSLACIHLQVRSNRRPRVPSQGTSAHDLRTDPPRPAEPKSPEPKRRKDMA